MTSSQDTGTIQGCFGKRKIYFRYKKPENASSDYFIFFHGSFSSSYHNEKAEMIASRITENGLGNVFLYETSRELYTFEIGLPFEEYKKAFGPKTYGQELEDVRRAFGFFMKTFVKDPASSRLHFVGFSLGGTQCSYLLPEYGALVRDVFLFGSGITTKVKGSTYEGYPPKEEILANYIDYRGNIHLIQGSRDTVVPKEEALEVLAASQGNVKNHIVLEGVDHSFRKLNGNLNIRAIGEMIYDVIADHLEGPGVGREATISA